MRWFSGNWLELFTILFWALAIVLIVHDVRKGTRLSDACEAKGGALVLAWTGFKCAKLLDQR